MLLFFVKILYLLAVSVVQYMDINISFQRTIWYCCFSNSLQAFWNVIYSLLPECMAVFQGRSRCQGVMGSVQWLECTACVSCQSNALLKNAFGQFSLDFLLEKQMLDVYVWYFKQEILISRLYTSCLRGLANVQTWAVL